MIRPEPRSSETTVGRVIRRVPGIVPWSALGHGGLLALGVVFALSTQFLFQFGLYEVWSVPEILLGWVEHLGEQSFVGAFLFAGAAAALRIPTSSTSRRIVLLGTLMTLGAMAGEWLLMLRLPLPDSISTAGILLSRVARWLVVASLATLLLLFHRQAAGAAARIYENDLRRIRLDQQMTQARLQSLRAQIEPHFLFNTLANVQQLYRTEPGRGREMLANFIRYLRTALPQMREHETTLRHEVDLVRAYFDVLQVRMGARLKVRYDIPEELAGLAFPTLALSTLAENAIKHGLNPLPDGGTIEVTARADGADLAVSIADTGAGLRSSSGTGTGIANLRARLAALYGDGARLMLEANAPRGIRASIVVPVGSVAPKQREGVEGDGGAR